MLFRSLAATAAATFGDIAATAGDPRNATPEAETAGAKGWDDVCILRARYLCVRYEFFAMRSVRSGYGFVDDAHEIVRALPERLVHDEYGRGGV